jgi:N-acetylglucosamine-6-phosphate deacetylase
MGVLDRKGTLETGKDADIIMFSNDEELNLLFVMQMGNVVRNEL